ncbi:MAG: hypothetical protein KH366_13190 [Clostridiaceae bacterium]|nr:hypothetical protein [Clostridiaceae bacterium]
MDNLDYVLGYTLESLNEYTVYSAHKLVEILISDGIATKKNKEKEEKVYIGEMNDRIGLTFCVGKENKAIKSIEKWEFDKNYRYSMLYQLNQICNRNLFLEALEQNKIICYDELESYENLNTVAQMPSLLEKENGFFLKFNFKLDAVDSVGENYKKRYSIIAVFYKGNNLIELRFDSLEAIFTKERFKYAYQVIEWIRFYLNMEIRPMNLTPIIDYIKKNGKNDGVVLAGQDMLMASGAKATVDVGNDDSMVLPFIGEVKLLMKKYEEEFKKVPEIKEAFEEFIYEKENLSEFPWVKFKFSCRSFEVKFTFDVGKDACCLLQHYHSPLKVNQGRGRMDYVTDYIIKIRNLIDSPSECR